MRTKSSFDRTAIARFLNYFPQYTLDDLRDRLSLEDFQFLYAGMIDNVAPEATESAEEKIARRVRESHLKQRGRRGRW